MSLLSQSGIILTAYLAAGRLGAVAACLVLEISPWVTLLIAVLIDFFQIPVYGLTLETSKKHLILPKRFQTWADKKSELFRTRIHGKKYWRNLLKFQPVGVIVVTTVPFRGFGVLSATVLAVMLGYGRIKATALILIGSIIGSLFAIWAFLIPGRYFGVL